MTLTRTFISGILVWLVFFIGSFILAGYFGRSASAVSWLASGATALLLFCVGWFVGKRTGVILWTEQLTPIAGWVGIGVIADWLFRTPFVGERLFLTLGYWMVWIAFGAGALFALRRKTKDSRKKWFPIL